MRFGHRFLCLFGTNLVPSWASTWTHLGSQEPPKSPPKTHLGARTRPDPQNDSKMEPPTPQNDASDPSFWIDVDANFGDFLRTYSLRYFLQLGIILMSISSQARWRVRSSAARWIRRARPCGCAWRTESDTLIFLSFSFPS